MSSGKKFSCFIIGADSLLVECGEILLAQGHDILGIISGTERIIRWAHEKGLPVLDPRSDYRSALQERPFDYFFSITHLALIPDDILAMPDRFAVNFHDGPLPAYAGLNAPAWALMNREERYGISWHIITPEVDKGDILKQRMFDIAPGETALSINTRCFEAGIETFSDLVEEMAENRVVASPQDLSARSYYEKSKRPSAACTLDWRRPAGELEALVRALYFGPYANPLGVSKIFHGASVYVVNRARVHEQAQAGKPGTILDFDEKGIQVATGEDALEIREITTLQGEKVAPEDLLSALSLRRGDRFAVMTDELSEKLTAANRKASAAEGFWVRRLLHLEPVDLPSHLREDDSANQCSERASISVPAVFRERYSTNMADALGAAFAVFLARVCGKQRFHLGYSDPALRDQASGVGGWFAARVPLLFNVNPEKPFDVILNKFQTEEQRIDRRGCWSKDVLARYPEFNDRPELLAGRLLPVAVDRVAHISDATKIGAGLVLNITSDGSCGFWFDPAFISSERLVSLSERFSILMESIAKMPDQPIAQSDLLFPEERQQVLVDWNQTETAYPTDRCIHHLFEERAAMTPNHPALIFEDRSLSYGELNERANRLANLLRTKGVGPDSLVGVYVERSLDLMVATIATQKAGGAYVPLDPSYPQERIAFMIEDSGVPIILTQTRLAADVADHGAQHICLDGDLPIINQHSSESPDAPVGSNHLAYMIYTSGSTGKPKGVLVEHRNVVNFFTAMDACIPHDPPGIWLAVTSLSFDISVLELFWTLARGFTVVIHLDRERTQAVAAGSNSARPIDFGLFYWGNDEGEGRQKYRLLLEGAKFADQHEFSSVWTPERHFHAFGGPYPNPAVTGAAVAAVTSNLQIRSGSCVLPLHHPIRVAEEWSVIDNISAGRVALAFASGWQPNDFVLRPENFKDNKKVMFQAIEEVKKLWRGETVAFPGPLGEDVAVTTQPRPVQKELPIWITTAGNPDSYRQAASIGANILTHLLGQTVEEVGEKIVVYRQALADNGYDPEAGKVSLMLHTFVGDDENAVREIVRQPMKDYLSSSVSLVKNYAWAFPAFKKPKGVETPNDIDLSSLSPEELDAILDHAFERYFVTSGLFGTPQTCLTIIDKLKKIGVDEIACLIDFGVPTETVLDSMEPLARLRELANTTPETTSPEGDYSIAAQIRRHDVSHLQCTPSMARMMVAHDETRPALGLLNHLLVGGEAFPASLAHELADVVTGTLTNMYGPTETTIWSSSQAVSGKPASIPIGKPIANNRLYILDAMRQPVPVGVPGELYIGGEGVVRGYYHRDALTAERFLDDSFNPGGRMYRTGDLTRFREDGVIEFLGRLDHQVKVRGYRIELGEIEALLNRRERVREAVVVAREGSTGDQQLVAYLVAEGDAPESDTLRTALRKALPEYMVPSIFAVLERFPLTPNGKIDRNALPDPDTVKAKSKTVYVAPENELEEIIASVWQETLGHKQVGVNDNFFDIGGHSLLVVRMHRRMREVVEQPVALTDLYRFTTIRSLTEYLTGGGSDVLQKSADRAQRRKDLMGRRKRRRGR